jgi:hypothetical protein
LLAAATVPGGLQAREDGRVKQAVGQRLPGLDLDALAAAGRDQLAHGAEGVEVLDDHARVEHRLAAIEHLAGHLAQRVALEDVVLAPDVFGHELGVELLLRHDDAHLAHVGAGQ